MIIKKLNETTIIQYSRFIRITTIIGFLFLISGLFCKNCFVLKGAKFTEPVNLFVLFTKHQNIFYFLVQLGLMIILANPIIGLAYLAIKSSAQRAYSYAVLCISIILFLLVAITVFFLYK